VFYLQLNRGSFESKHSCLMLLSLFKLTTCFRLCTGPSSGRKISLSLSLSIYIYIYMYIYIYIASKCLCCCVKLTCRPDLGQVVAQAVKWHCDWFSSEYNFFLSLGGRGGCRDDAVVWEVSSCIISGLRRYVNGICALVGC